MSNPTALVQKLWNYQIEITGQHELRVDRAVRKQVDLLGCPGRHVLTPAKRLLRFGNRGG